MNASTSAMSAPAVSRSTLVSVLGWLGIIAGALAAFSALVEFQFFGTLAETPAPEMQPIQEPLFRWFQGITLVNLAIAGFLMYSGYALWRRRNWARVTYIVLYVIGIVAIVIGVSLSALFGSLFSQFGAAFGAVFVVIALLALGVIALFGWLIKRLNSAPVKSEFA